MSNLKQCPFCGGEVEIRKNGYMYEDKNKDPVMVICKKCNANSGWQYEEDERYEAISINGEELYKRIPRVSPTEKAIRAWNKRGYLKDIADEIEREVLGKPVPEEFKNGIYKAIKILMKRSNENE